jgi:ABC-type transport system substrate-binding protein
MSQGLGYGTWIPVYQIIPRVNGAFVPNDQLPVLRTYDPDKAKQLVQDISYDGTKLYIYSAPAARQADAEQSVEHYLNAAGINVELKNLDQATYSTYQVDGWKNGMLIQALAAYPNYNHPITITLDLPLPKPRAGKRQMISGRYSMPVSIV